jgi:transcriptional regulator of acetoin/glycerol metabolism
METIEINDHLDNIFNIHSINKNGFGPSGTLFIFPFQSPKREIKLNRTKYTILNGDHFSIDFKECTIFLPTYKNEKFKLELVLVVDPKNAEKNCFKLNTLLNVPFKLNGNWVFSAMLECGDNLEIGINKLLLRSDIKSDVTRQNLNPKMIRGSWPILIEGETGTGKTKLAQLIHDESGVNGMFVHLNLQGFSKNLIESELFGHVKGAYTGAVSDRTGAMLMAQKGTLFIDEIDSVSKEIQTKLLLFLDTGEFSPVGSERKIKSSARLIFASGRSLKDVLDNNELRKDFYFRLKTSFNIKLNSLRNEQQLIEDFISQFEIENGVHISIEAKNFYLKYPWPGNFRQLKSHLEKKMILAAGKKIILEKIDWDLNELQLFNSEKEMIKTLNELKNDYCNEIYLKLNQNMSHTCKVLDIAPGTLRASLKNQDVRIKSI